MTMYFMTNCDTRRGHETQPWYRSDICRRSGGAQHGLHIAREKGTVEAAGVQAPRFEVDPMWPKPLPNHWVQGNTIGVSVDSKDHIWIIHRAGSLEAKEVYASAKPPAAECCKPAPAVLEFDEDGNLLGSWGGEDGPGYQWPASNHGITVDYKGNVWIGRQRPHRERAAYRRICRETLRQAPRQLRPSRRPKGKGGSRAGPALSRQHGPEVQP
jgi:hypothetical protein